MSYQCPRPCENKTQYGYCKTTYCINPQFSNLGTWQQTVLQHGTLKLKPLTNADRIRAMSDEELADELLSLFADFHEYEVEWSTEVILDWLKEEAKA